MTRMVREVEKFTITVYRPNGKRWFVESASAFNYHSAKAHLIKVAAAKAKMAIADFEADADFEIGFPVNCEVDLTTGEILRRESY